MTLWVGASKVHSVKVMFLSRTKGEVMSIVTTDLQRLGPTCGDSEFRDRPRRLVIKIESNGRHAH